MAPTSNARLRQLRALLAKSTTSKTSSRKLCRFRKALCLREAKIFNQLTLRRKGIRLYLITIVRAGIHNRSGRDHSMLQKTQNQYYPTDGMSGCATNAQHHFPSCCNTTEGTIVLCQQEGTIVSRGWNVQQQATVCAVPSNHKTPLKELRLPFSRRAPSTHRSAQAPRQKAMPEEPNVQNCCLTSTSPRCLLLQRSLDEWPQVRIQLMETL